MNNLNEISDNVKEVVLSPISIQILSDSSENEQNELIDAGLIAFSKASEELQIQYIIMAQNNLDPFDKESDELTKRIFQDCYAEKLAKAKNILSKNKREPEK